MIILTGLYEIIVIGFAVLGAFYLGNVIEIRFRWVERLHRLWVRLREKKSSYWGEQTYQQSRMSG